MFRQSSHLLKHVFLSADLPSTLTVSLPHRASRELGNPGSRMATLPKAEQILQFVLLGKHLHVNRGFCFNLTLSVLQFQVILLCES